MFDRPESGERAVLVHTGLGRVVEQEHLEEFSELASSAGAQAVAKIVCQRHAPDPRHFVGSGKAGEIREAVDREEADLVLFDQALSPSQERNLEHLLGCRVLDRSGLILDIFAQRARSHEGKLQVELAQLRHLSTRLVRGWTHLERQKGGIGLRGPGETQLETDRRLVYDRIRHIRNRLAQVAQRRDLGRQSRRKAEVKTVSIVGYTNAGKSTLFNHLTGSGVYAADQLFATLDPTLRRLDLPGCAPIILADTVGFIGNLPHELIAAFRSTLQETIEASLILHVIDAASPSRQENVAEVYDVLSQIGAAEVPCLEVYNKVDLIESKQPFEPVYDAHGQAARVWTSAKTGVGTDSLLHTIAQRVAMESVHGWVCLPSSAGRLRARLFDLGAVIAERSGEEGQLHLEVKLAHSDMQRLTQREGLDPSWVLPVT